MHSIGKTIRFNKIIGKLPKDFGAIDMTTVVQSICWRLCRSVKNLTFLRYPSECVLDVKRKADAKMVLICIAILYGYNVQSCSIGCYSVASGRGHDAVWFRMVAATGRCSTNLPIWVRSLQLQSSLLPAIHAAQVGRSFGSSSNIWGLKGQMLCPITSAGRNDPLTDTWIIETWNILS